MCQHHQNCIASFQLLRSITKWSCSLDGPVCCAICQVHCTSKTLGPRILLKHALLFSGFMEFVERFYFCVKKSVEKIYSILLIKRCVYFEEY